MAKLVYGTESYNLPDDFSEEDFERAVTTSSSSGIVRFPLKNDGLLVVVKGTAALAYHKRPMSTISY